MLSNDPMELMMGITGRVSVSGPVRSITLLPRLWLWPYRIAGCSGWNGTGLTSVVRLPT